MKRCGDFSPIGVDQPNPNKWASQDVSARLLRKKGALSDVAFEIAQLRKSGAFDGLATILDAMNESNDSRAHDTEMKPTPKTPESSKLLEILRLNMGPQNRHRFQESSSSDEEDDDEEDEEEQL